MQTDLAKSIDDLKYIDWNQYHFVFARSMLKDNQAALDKIGRSQSWLATLPNKSELETLANELKADRLTQASIMIRDSVLDAVMVMTNDLKSPDRKLRQAAAKDILDRAGLKAPDKTQVELIATIAARTLEDVLTQVYGQPEQLPPGDVIDGTIIDSE